MLPVPVFLQSRTQELADALLSRKLSPEIPVSGLPQQNTQSPFNFPTQELWQICMLQACRSCRWPYAAQWTPCTYPNTISYEPRITPYTRHPAP